MALSPARHKLYACWRNDHFGRRVGFRFFDRRGVRVSGFQRRSNDFEEETAQIISPFRCPPLFIYINFTQHAWKDGR